MDVQEDLYDEFGNYIGPEIDSDEDADAPEIEDGDDESGDEEERMEYEGGVGGDALLEDAGGDGDDETRVVLHEDKKYYPTAMEVYGEEVETTVQDEDTMPITQGVVAAIKAKNFDIVEKKQPTHVYSQEFLVSMMKHPNLVRNVAVIGHLHHGKTTFVDMLVEQTHYFEAPKTGVAKAEATQKEDRRYTDSRVDEQQRGLSIKASPMTMLLQASTEKHYLFNLMDTPGHVNFSDEATAGMRLADGCLLVVDVVEGLMLNAERLLRHAVQERLPVVLCVNKMDRLPLELKLPPQDAYFKIRQVIEEVNTLLASVSGGTYPRLSPEVGNVIFASSYMSWSFTLKSFAAIYSDAHPTVDPTTFARRLWGDVYFQPRTRGFKRKPPEGGGPRTFVQFVLEPLYKLVTLTISEPEADVRAELGEMGIVLKKDEYKLDPKPLVKLVMSRFFGETSAGMVDSLVAHLPSPEDGAKAKIEQTYSGSLQEDFVPGMLACDADAMLMVSPNPNPSPNPN